MINIENLTSLTISFSACITQYSPEASYSISKNYSAANNYLIKMKTYPGDLITQTELDVIETITEDISPLLFYIELVLPYNEDVNIGFKIIRGSYLRLSGKITKKLLNSVNSEITWNKSLEIFYDEVSKSGNIFFPAFNYRDPMIRSAELFDIEILIDNMLINPMKFTAIRCFITIHYIGFTIFR